MGAVESMAERLAAPKVSRVVHTFKVPQKIPGDVREVGLHELTTAEELMVEKRTRGNSASTPGELVIQALASVNGNPVSVADGSSDKAWKEMHPKLRALMQTAWVRIHLPKDEEVEGFLESEEVGV